MFNVELIALEEVVLRGGGGKFKDRVVKRRGKVRRKDSPKHVGHIKPLAGVHCNKLEERFGVRNAIKAPER